MKPSLRERNTTDESSLALDGYGVLDGLPNSAFTIDEAGVITYSNAAAERVFRYERQELVGQALDGLIAGAGQFDPLEYLHDHAGGGGSAPGHELIARRKDGSAFSADLKVSELNAQGRTIFLVLVTEVPSCKSADERVVFPLSAEGQYRQVVSNSLGLMCEHDLDGNLLFINRAAAEALGYSAEDCIGMNIKNLLSPPVRDLFDDYLRRIQREGTDSGLMRIATRCGDERHWFYHNVIHREPTGRLSVLGHALDITECKQAEQTLRESERRFRNLIEGSIQGILIHENRKPLFVNRSFADILGYDSPEQILAMDSTDPLVAPYERERLRAYTNARLRDEPAPVQYEYDALRKDGSIVTLQTFVRVINWDGKRAIHDTVIDLSERKGLGERTSGLLRQDRALANRLITAQEEERRNLVRELHDELGQSLTAIKSEATFISGRMENRDADVYQSARGIVSVVSRIYDAVHAMMWRLRPSTLDELGLGDAVEGLVRAWRARHPRIRCRLEMSGELDSLGEAVNITVYRIVQECLTNVIRHAAASNVNITLERSSSGAGADDQRDPPTLVSSAGMTRQSELSKTTPSETTLRLVVEDNGRGMDIENAKKRADGLGLLGMRERLEALGGTLVLASEIGKGLRLSAKIPI